ncbi:MAG: hypothetical protein NTU57_00150 [Candidatus Aenigmarchaeota archaeon]|nr:hypothetical protein [Candidatus Aenigmarchaeota archaeon]
MNSSLGNFTVTPDTLYVNWTSGVINITSIAANDTFYHIQNTTEALSSQYFSSSIYPQNSYTGYNGTNTSYCFTSGASGMKFYVQNASSGAYTNLTDFINISIPTLYNIIAYQFCPPGLYNGTFNVTRNSTFIDYAIINASIIIPVSTSNTFSEASSYGFVRGTVTTGSNLIHKFYFNTSIAQNLTGVFINLTDTTDQTEDIDAYLFDSSGTLLVRSAENGTTMDNIYRELPSTSDMWQLWVLGNVSSSHSYHVNISFSTLNATNANDGLQQITSLDFGEFTPVNNQSSQINVTLRNIDTTEWSSVMQRSEIYRTETWTMKNTTGDYYFIVPSFATKVKIKIEWKGQTRWTVALNKTDTFVGNSSRKYQTGNLTSTTQEENVIYTGAISESNDGLWKISVGNISAIGDDKYNVTAQVWYNSSYWLSSDYPASGFNFNSSLGLDNSTKNVSLRITLPPANINNGNYSGFVEYYRDGSWAKRIPLSFSVRAGTLIINNTLSTVTETRHDNIGFNRAGDGALWVNLTLNNTGGSDIYFVNTTSNYTLLNSGYNISFDVQWPSSPIAAGTQKTMNISITINTNNTQNTQGLYYGEIILNTTNSTNSSSVSYPFNVYYVYLYVNLTDVVIVNVTDVSPTFIALPNISNNMTFNVTAMLANGSVISQMDLINENHFTNIRLIEGNLSANNITTLGSYGKSNISAPWDKVCPTSGGYTYCRINATQPNGAPPGGTYYGYVTVNFNTLQLGGTGERNISGTGRTAVPVTINDSGLKLHPDIFNDDNGFYENKIAYFSANISNYGPLGVTNAFVIFKKSSSTDCTNAIYSVIRTNATCSVGTVVAGSGNDIWNVTLPGFMIGATNCTLRWRVTANAVNANTDCNMILGIANNYSNFGNYTQLYITVLDNTTTTTDEDEGGGGQTTTCSSNITCGDTQYCKSGTCTNLVCQSGYVASAHKCVQKAGKLEVTDYTSKVYVVQGATNATKVTVKNTGGYLYTTKMTATSPISELTATVTPASYSLGISNSGIFTVTFTTTEATEVGYHTVTVKAYASENGSVYVTKDIIVGVQPAEGGKTVINTTRDDLKALFASVTTLFNQLPPSAEQNYTLANRTYTRILNMFQEVESNIQAGNYLEANSLLTELNASIAEFRSQVSGVGAAGIGSLFGGDMSGTLMLVAILVVIVVIGAFLAYLLMPSKKGYHPVLGYLPKEKTSIMGKITHAFSKLKFGGRQKSLGDFGARSAAPSVQPTPVQQARPDNKTYADGYHRLDQFGLTYDKTKFKDREKK